MLVKRKKRGVGAKKLPKAKAWTTRKADKQFSAFIRKRDGKCQHPNCQEIERLQCSHFWGRSISATRYDPENCIALCYRHHYGDTINGWENRKQGEYRDHMIKLLGQKKYDELAIRSREAVQRMDAILKLMTWL